MLFSIFFVVMGWRGEVRSEGETANPWLVTLVASPFFVAGTVLAFGRSGVVIDLHKRTITRWWGLLVPMKKTEDDLSLYEHVEISKKVVRNKNSTTTYYPVLLKGTGPDVKFENPTTHKIARRHAEELAKFLHFDLVDSSGFRVRKREAGTLDETFAEFAKRTGKCYDWPQMPADSRIFYDTQGDNAIIDLPKPPFNPLMLVGFAPLLMIAFFIAQTGIVFDGGADDEFDMVFAGFVAAFVGIFIFAGAATFIRMWRPREHLVVSHEGVLVEQRKGFMKKKVLMPADEIEEIFCETFESRLKEFPAEFDEFARKHPKTANVVLGLRHMNLHSSPDQGVTVRSDRDALTFGAHLRPDEMQWLHDAICHILLSRA